MEPSEFCFHEMKFMQCMKKLGVVMKTMKPMYYINHVNGISLSQQILHITSPARLVHNPNPPIDLPPSTASVLPVIMPASSLSNQPTATATSSGVASFLSGIWLFITSRAAASHCLRASSVSTTVGRTVLTRIPWAPSSRAWRYMSRMMCWRGSAIWVTLTFGSGL